MEDKTSILPLQYYDENEDGDIELSFPVPLSLRRDLDKSYTSLFFSSFSISQKIETQISNLIDFPKWNETTFIAQFHETLAKNIMKTTGVKILRCSDVARHASEWIKGGERQLPQTILDCRNAYENLSRENTIKYHNNNNDVIRIFRMNASLFFTLLFTDIEFNNFFTIEDKILIGNALTIAVWKERLECRLILHPEQGEESIDEILKYTESHDDNVNFFTDFCNNRIIWNYDMRKLLKISPWCGFAAVIQRINEIVGGGNKRGLNFHQRKTGSSRSLLRDCISIILEPTFFHTIKGDYMHTTGKRLWEDQYFLMKLLPLISLQPQENKREVKRLIHEIRQLTHANVAIDTQGGIELYTKHSMDLLEIVLNHPTVKHEMTKINEELSEYVSNILVGVMSKTGEKLMQKSVNYFIFIPFAIQIMRIWRNKGMFASLQYTMESTINTIGRHLTVPFSHMLIHH